MLRSREAHCFEGAIFAAALLWYQGRPPTLLLLEAPQDFDHNLIIYERDGKVGSVSQSRHKKLLGKPAIYASNRDLVMAYYPDYTSDWTHDPNDFTLRGFSDLIDLRKYGEAWVAADEVWEIYNTFVVGVRFEMLVPAQRVGTLLRISGRTPDGVSAAAWPAGGRVSRWASSGRRPDAPTRARSSSVPTHRGSLSGAAPDRSCSHGQAKACGDPESSGGGSEQDGGHFVSIGTRQGILVPKQGKERQEDLFR